nr:hypothetical protein [Tanacetum cinerariifolium]
PPDLSLHRNHIDIVTSSPTSGHAPATLRPPYRRTPPRRHHFPRNHDHPHHRSIITLSPPTPPHHKGALVRCTTTHKGAFGWQPPPWGAFGSEFSTTGVFGCYKDPQWCVGFHGSRQQGAFDLVLAPGTLGRNSIKRMRLVHQGPQRVCLGVQFRTKGRHSGKEKVTLDDLFLLHSMDGGARVVLVNDLEVLRNFTLGSKTSLLNVEKMVDIGICRYDGLGYGEMVDGLPDNGRDEDTKVGVGEGQDDDKGVRRRPNITFSNRLRAMDERLGDIKTNISTLSTEVEDLTYVVSGMSKQYDQFYGRHSGKEKVTLDDLFLLHSMDGGARVVLVNDLEVLRNFTLGSKTSLLNVEKMVDIGICRYDGLGYGEMVDGLPDNGRDEDTKVGVGEGQDDDKGVRRRPNITFSNRLRAMDERLGDIKTNISTLSTEVEDLTYVVSGMSKQYDQFYGEFRQMRLEQQRFQTRNTNHLS